LCELQMKCVCQVWNDMFSAADFGSDSQGRDISIPDRKGTSFRQDS
jgi:hypothetical protein